MAQNLGIQQAIVLVDSFVQVADLLNIHLMLSLTLTFQTLVFQTRLHLSVKRDITVTEQDKRLVIQELTCLTLKQKNATIVHLVMHAIQQELLTLKRKPVDLDMSATA